MKSALLAALLVFSSSSFSQQSQVTTPVEIKMLEYVWEAVALETSSVTNKRVSVLTDEETRILAQKGLSNGFGRSWKLVDTSIKLDVKQLALIASAPKFKVKVKEKAPGKVFLYLQVFDKYFPTVYDDDDTMLSAELNVRYRLVNGGDATLIEEKNFNISIWRLTCARGGQVIEKFPFFPDQVFLLFDSIASWVTSGNEHRKSLELLPACAFSGKGHFDTPLDRISFKSSPDGISLISPAGFDLRRYPPKYARTDAKKNIGGNALGSVFTLFTGVSVDKKRHYNYTAALTFEDGKRIYECIIPYYELEVAESERINNEDGSKTIEKGEYFLAARNTDTSIWNSITVLGDTVVKFKIKFFTIQNIPDSVWNGSDTSTIRALQKKWKSGKLLSDVKIYGELDGEQFSMTSSNGASKKTFIFSDRSSITFYGRVEPTSADVYKQLTGEQLKLATIVSAIPYDFFNYSVSGY